MSVGEDGPEAILPLRRGANGKLGIVRECEGCWVIRYDPPLGQGDWRAR